MALAWLAVTMSLALVALPVWDDAAAVAVLPWLLTGAAEPPRRSAAPAGPSNMHYLGDYRGLARMEKKMENTTLFSVGSLYKDCTQYPLIMENQMEKKMDNDKEAEAI